VFEILPVVLQRRIKLVFYYVFSVHNFFNDDKLKYLRGLIFKHQSSIESAVKILDGSGSA